MDGHYIRTVMDAHERWVNVVNENWERDDKATVTRL